MTHPIEDFENSLHHESPDSGALTNFGVALREKLQGLTHAKDQFAKFQRYGGIIHGDAPDESFKVFQERVLEDYLVLHRATRARTSLAECPCPGVASAFAMASSKAAKTPGSSSLHSLEPGLSFSTKADHDFMAIRRRSSGESFSSSASISARLMVVTSRLRAESSNQKQKAES